MVKSRNGETRPTNSTSHQPPAGSRGSKLHWVLLEPSGGLWCAVRDGTCTRDAAQLRRLGQPRDVGKLHRVYVFASSPFMPGLYREKQHARPSLCSFALWQMIEMGWICPDRQNFYRYSRRREGSRFGCHGYTDQGNAEMPSLCIS